MYVSDFNIFKIARRLTLFSRPLCLLQQESRAVFSATAAQKPIKKNEKKPTKISDKKKERGVVSVLKDRIVTVLYFSTKTR